MILDVIIPDATETTICDEIHGVFKTRGVDDKINRDIWDTPFTADNGKFEYHYENSTIGVSQWSERCQRFTTPYEMPIYTSTADESYFDGKE